MATTKTPDGLNAPGRRLWRSVVSAYDLEAPELAILNAAARCADALEQLQDTVKVEGTMLGDKAHPALVEARQQAICLSRLVAALRIPAEEDATGEHDATAGRPQYRGIRGVYATGGLGGAA
jgi:hypothetical protein